MKFKSHLLLDIGNSHTVAGLVRDGTIHPRIRFRTDAAATSDEYRALLEGLFSRGILGGVDPLWDSIGRVVISTVVPALERVIREACAPVPLLSIRSTLRQNFTLEQLPEPSSLGADRLANLAGALVLPGIKPPFLIVDAGTATTFCLLNSAASYVGGAITPGVEISWKALTSRAAKLFSVPLVRPTNSVGTTTETQLQSGLLQGYEALIEGMCERLIKDAGPEFKQAQWIATGGCINLLKLSSRFLIDPDLTLKGLLEYDRQNPLS